MTQVGGAFPASRKKRAAGFLEIALIFSHLQPTTTQGEMTK